MRSSLPLALIALYLLAGCATTPSPSEPRINLLRPSECLTACPQLPAPTDRDEIAVTLWTLDLIDAAAECRRMHETCRHAGIEVAPMTAARPSGGARTGFGAPLNGQGAQDDPEDEDEDA